MSMHVCASVHMQEGQEIAVEFVKRHDHVREDYYRVVFGDCVVYLSRAQLADLLYKIEHKQ